MGGELANCEVARVDEGVAAAAVLPAVALPAVELAPKEVLKAGRPRASGMTNGLSMCFARAAGARGEGWGAGRGGG